MEFEFWWLLGFPLFFAFGWLVAIGVIFQLGLNVVVARIYNQAAEGWSTVGQAISDAEGRALTGVRHTSRSQYLEPLRPILRSKEALRNPSRRLFGSYDGDLPQSFDGFTKFEEGVRYRFPIISFYAAWGDKPEQQFPVRMLSTIDRMGSVAMVTPASVASSGAMALRVRIVTSNPRAASKGAKRQNWMVSPRPCSLTRTTRSPARNSPSQRGSGNAI